MSDSPHTFNFAGRRSDLSAAEILASVARSLFNDPLRNNASSDYHIELDALTIAPKARVFATTGERNGVSVQIPPLQANLLAPTRRSARIAASFLAHEKDRRHELQRQVQHDRRHNWRRGSRTDLNLRERRRTVGTPPLRKHHRMQLHPPAELSPPSRHRRIHALRCFALNTLRFLDIDAIPEPIRVPPFVTTSKWNAFATNFTTVREAGGR